MDHAACNIFSVTYSVFHYSFFKYLFLNMKLKKGSAKVEKFEANDEKL